MMRALLKKQLLELLSSLMSKGTRGRSRGKMILFAVLILYCIFAGGVLFYLMADSLCAPLAQSDHGWLYFALMGLMATALGVFGSVFMTYSGLYQAKDNELLLSMPIPPGRILLVRLISCYGTALLFEALVLIPAALVWGLNGFGTAQSTVLLVLLVFLLPLLALALSCLLGWVLALVLVRVRHRSLLTLAISLGFLAAYFYVYSQATRYLQLLLVNAEQVGRTMRTAFYPFYLLGRGTAGDAGAFALFALIALAAAALTCFLLSRGYLQLMTTHRGAAKARYREKALRASSAGRALLRKELRRLWSSPVYLVNSCLGIVLTVVGAVLLPIKGAQLREILSMFGQDYTGLLVAAGICLMASMNLIAAPSVSLEGSSLYLLQSLPITGWQALRSKLLLQLIPTVPTLALLGLSAGLSLQLGWGWTLTLTLLGIAAAAASAAFGLIVGLKMPILDWTNETVPVKQGMAVMVSMFGGWGAVVVLGAGWFLLRKSAAPLLYAVLATILLFALGALLTLWLKRRGEKVLAKL